MAFLFILSLVQAWETGARMPTPRMAFATGRVGTRVFAIGGFGEDMRYPRAEVEAYDVEADSWITGFAPMPWPRAYAGCAVLGGKIYVIGGTDTRMETNRVDRFDPGSNTWDTVASLPWPAQALGAAVLGNHLYAVGGYSTYNEGRYLREVACYVPTPAPGSWDTVYSLHVPRAGLGLAVSGDRMYAVGGTYFNPLASAEYYVLDQWRIEPMPMRHPRSGFPAVGYAEYICAIGGHGRMNMGSVEVLNTLIGEWSDAESLPSARTEHGGAVVGDRIVVIGGREMHGLVGTVLTHPLFSGMEEQSEEPFRREAAQATVASGCVRLPGAGAWDVFDNAGKKVAAGAGPGEVRLSPGIYFVRTALPDRSLTTYKVTIPR
ncbi:MAG: hypothetical protein JSU73_12830 [candidate division WOR-3 bacterium]|nr:MAG: hypothetical protein JSU73_12830 [candidate division WOR-3 bacterium]